MVSITLYSADSAYCFCALRLVKSKRSAAFGDRLSQVNNLKNRASDCRPTRLRIGMAAATGTRIMEIYRNGRNKAYALAVKPLDGDF